MKARRAGPNGNTIANHAIYLRKPGPRSETPQTGQEWDELLNRCIQNRRDEMFDDIRAVIMGAVPQALQEPAPDRLDEFIIRGFERWRHFADQLPAGVGPKLERGRHCFAFEIIGERRPVTLAGLPDVLRASQLRLTGWPPFWYPTRPGIAPYPVDGLVECWLGGDEQTPPERRDAGHSDFWRLHPDGRAFLLRGYQEDGMDGQRDGRPIVQPGTQFDASLPVWRVGETILFAKSLSDHLFEGPTTIKFDAIYQGLEGRQLASVDGRRMIFDGQVSRQDEIRLSTHVETNTIDANLPEIVHPLLTPLYALFDFFELPMRLVVEELASMRGRR